MQSSASDGNCAQVQVRLCTKQQQHAVPDFPLSVPITVDPAALNNLVNSLLSEANENHQRVEFDFLVDGVEILRQSLQQFLNQTSASISIESLITVEYCEQTAPPRPHTNMPHDDWVSCVRADCKLLVSGCYDSTVHVWSLTPDEHSTPMSHRLTIPGHTEPLKCLDIVSAEHEDGVMYFVSGSTDQTLMVWRYCSVNNSVECTAVLSGHMKSVDCVSAAPNITASNTRPLIASGCWDSEILLWDARAAISTASAQDVYLDNNCSVTTQDEAEERGVKKRRRTSKKRTSACAVKRSSVATLCDHKEGVSGLGWLSQDELVSCSWDHTLRLWDINTGGMKTQLAGNKAFFSLSCRPLDGAGGMAGCVLTTSADRHVRLYDPRSREGSVVKTTFTSHVGWVSDVSWSSHVTGQFVTCGHDCSVKQWDVRCPSAPLYDLQGHTDKVLACHWSRDGGFIASGAADNTVKVFSTDQ